MKYIINWKKDVEVERFAASSKGGQNANKTEVNVRLTHLPSGIKAQATGERSLDHNFKNAVRVLVNRIMRWLESKKEALPPKDPATFGYQRRTYYSDRSDLVKDHETGEEGRFGSVMKGKIDNFIEASLRKNI